MLHNRRVVSLSLTPKTLSLLNQISIMKTGELKSMSAMVREAIDEFINKDLSNG